jgi:hypothetical protein
MPPSIWGADLIRIDRDAAIDRANDAIDGEVAAALEGDLDHLGDIGLEAFMQRHAAETAFIASRRSCRQRRVVSAAQQDRQGPIAGS